MKIKLGRLLFLLCIMTGFSINTAYAIELAEINLRLKALIVESSCEVVVTEQGMNVKLGSWATRGVKNPGDRTRGTPFTVQLKDCGENVSVSFSGKPDAVQNELLALDSSSTAKNVAIEISDQNKKRLPINTYTVPVVSGANNLLTLHFYANYYTTKPNVTAGQANASANLLIKYD